MRSDGRGACQAFCAMTALLAVAACGGGDASLPFGDVRALSAPTSVGAAPIVAVSRSGAEAAAWVSAPGGGSDGRLYVSVNGAPPVELRDSLGPIEVHGESPPKVTYAADGSLVAIYVVGRVVPGARFPLAALRFVRSRDGGRTWSAPVTVTDDGDFGSHNFHALHAADDGSLYVAWLGSRTADHSVMSASSPAPVSHTAGHAASGAHVTRSTDGGVTWSPSVRADVGEACPCCRTALGTSKDGTLYLAWRKVFPGNVRDVVVARSGDRGSTWSEPVRVHADDWVFDGCPHAGPSLQVDSAGRVHVAWWTGRPKAAGVYYARSDDGGKTFGPAVPLGVADFSRPAHVQLALGPNDLVATAWDDGTLETPRIVFRVSRDGGRSFAPAQPLSTMGRAAGFPVLAVSSSGVTVAWSEQSAEAADRDSKAMPDMKDPKAQQGLHAVGEAQVLVRRSTLQ